MSESTEPKPLANHQPASVLGKRDRSELEAEPESQRRVPDGSRGDSDSDSDSDLDQSDDDDEPAEDEEYYSESDTDERGAPFGQWPTWVTFVPEPREQERPFTAQEQDDAKALYNARKQDRSTLPRAEYREKWATDDVRARELSYLRRDKRAEIKRRLELVRLGKLSATDVDVFINEPLPQLPRNWRIPFDRPATSTETTDAAEEPQVLLDTLADAFMSAPADVEPIEVDTVVQSAVIERDSVNVKAERVAVDHVLEAPASAAQAHADEHGGSFDSAFRARAQACYGYIHNLLNVQRPKIDVPFASLNDATDRLIVYHVHQYHRESDDREIASDQRISEHAHLLLSRYAQLDQRMQDMAFKQDIQTPFEDELAISRFLFVVERDNLSRAKQFSAAASSNTPAAQRTITTASGRASTFLGVKPPSASPPPAGASAPLTATAQPASDSPAAMIAALSARYNEFRALSGTRALTAQETEIAKSIRAEIEKLTVAITSAAASGTAPPRA